MTPYRWWPWMPVSVTGPEVVAAPPMPEPVVVVDPPPAVQVPQQPEPAPEVSSSMLSGRVPDRVKPTSFEEGWREAEAAEAAVLARLAVRTRKSTPWDAARRVFGGGP